MIAPWIRLGRDASPDLGPLPYSSVVLVLDLGELLEDDDEDDLLTRACAPPDDSFSSTE
jgi:hypothetical protein